MIQISPSDRRGVAFKIMKKLLPIICAVILVAGMTAAAVLFDNREIIFPEIAAIAVGALVSPKFSWNANKLRIFIYITVCAILGVAIVKWLPLPIWAQMITAFLLAQILLVNSKTSFAPMISALVLPVMLQTDTVVYIISAMVLTALILLCRSAFEKGGVLEKSDFSPLPKPRWNEYGNIFLRTLFAAVIIVLAVLLNFRFVAAPPLLVAFTEFSHLTSKARSVPVKSVALITLCGLFGAALRYIFCIKLTVLPLYAVAALIMICVILLMKAIKLYIPPAGAIAILAVLIPESSVIWFPLQIFVGTSLIMLIARLFFKEKNSAPET